MVLARVPPREPMMTDPATRARAQAIAHWLSHQRAAPSRLTESTAWRLIDEARDRGIALDGPLAPLIVQPRLSLWLVGQLSGRPLMRVFPDRDAAVGKAKELGRELGVAVLVIGPAGEIAERIEPDATTRSVPIRLAQPILIARPVAVAPPIVAEPVEIPAVRVSIERSEGRWAVFANSRLITTAPTRERARLQARVLREDPGFMADPAPRPALDEA